MAVDTSASAGPGPEAGHDPDAGPRRRAGHAVEGAPEPFRRRTARYVALGLGAVLALLVAVLATQEPATTRLAGSPLLGRPAPALAGPSLLPGGDSFDLADQQGRWVLVNFFATWCVPCRVEHPDLLRFDAAHAEAGDARVVSVVFSDDDDDVASFFAEKGGSWPVIDDKDGRIALEFGVTGVPESYLVGPDGTVRSKVIGGVEFDELETLLARAQGGAGAPAR